MVASLLEIVGRKPSDLAIVDEFCSLTWADLNARTNGLVHALRERGLQEGDVVALVGGNRHEWIETMGAALASSLVLVPVNWHFTDEEIAYVLNNSGAKAVVADVEYVQKVDRAAEAAGVECRVVFGGRVPDGWEDYEEVVGEQDTSEPDAQGAGTIMFYTSGTTGRPKGVRSSMVRLGSDPAQALGSIGLFLGMLGIPEDGRVLLNAPAYHAGPLVFCVMPAVLGSTLVMRRSWDAAETLRLIDDHQLTTVYAVPTHFVRLLRLPQEVREGFDGSSLRVLYHTAAPCPPDIKRAMIEWFGPVIRELYAASESGGAGCAITAEEWLERPGSVGRPLPTTEVIIVGDDGRRLGPNEVGQIYLKNLLGADFEYLGDPEKTAAAHLEPGVFTFGDVGYVDEDGYLYLVDRKIDMIISGGVNIYPAEIEAVLVTHPAVADVAVIGVPDDEFGEQVKAVVCLEDGWEPGADLAEELKRHCRGKLAGYKVPRTVDFVDELPRTPTGKLLKRRLRDRYWEGRSSKI
ncbi:MAG: acyl-CoA synthetase [Acidimicrobiales bacterium]|nr:MAG: acyl-CoA synthetase [Acidimicrobiales bacterium]